MSSCGASCSCGCCRRPPSGSVVSNAPGLPEVAYRIGTYGTFRAELIRELAGSPSLAGLTTRDDHDFSIALLDGWAYLADVLTFYSERTVNEALLRTARLRDSLLYLAGMVGYRPSPGLAATVPLAFTVDAAARFVLPAGLQTQSVSPPGRSDPPVTFETLTPVTAIGGLNALPISPPSAPTPTQARDKGSTGAAFVPGSGRPNLNVGDRLLAWGGLDRSVQQVTVTDVTAERVTWAPPLSADRTSVAVLRRTFRAFAADVPAKYLATKPPRGADPPKVEELTTEPAHLKLAATTVQVPLDAVVPDLLPDTRLLVSTLDGTVAVPATVVGVASAAETVGPRSATVSVVTLSDKLGVSFDRSTVQIAEVSHALPLWDRAVPAAITGATVLAQLGDLAADILDRSVLLADATGAATEVRVVGVAPAGTTDPPSDPAAPLHRIRVEPPLTRQLQAATAALFGNVAPASEGKTVPVEFVGRGDAAVAFQRFPLQKLPLTRVPRAGAPHGGASTLVVRVAGTEWHEREQLYGAGPDARVFVVEVDDRGEHAVVFGDGVHGARLPTGAEVTAEYRSGLGTRGNVDAGAITSLITRPKGLSAVVNPLAAGGGADPEATEHARRNAPNTVRTFDRIVSLADVEDQARAHALVGKARARFAADRRGPRVELTLAGHDGVTLGPKQVADIRADLDARRDPNQRLAVLTHESLALKVEIRLVAIDPDIAETDALDAVEDAVLAWFAFDAQQFGQPVGLSDVFVAAHRARGVRGVDVQILTLVDPALRGPRGLTHARVNERIPLAGHELASLQASDLTVRMA